MIQRWRPTMVACVVLGWLASGVFAQDESQGQVKQKPKNEAGRSDQRSASAKSDPVKDKLSETRHTVTIDGVQMEYQATAGTLPLKTENGKLRANVFFVAYTKLGEKVPSKRPITFAFNGGPGSSAVWLHLGALGPRRVLTNDAGTPPPPPYRLVDNESSILDKTDLVFIDPVSTGYSRAAEGQNANQFHGVQQDIRSVADFIQQYITRFQRWNSPKFLAGESYGTTRAAGLSRNLQGRGIDLNGVILISSVLNFQTLRFKDGNDLPYPLFLPSFTATAWYHKKLPAELQGDDLGKVLAEVERFALGEYTVALMKGNKLTEDEQRQVARKLARFTGLSEDYILRAHLRIDMRFVSELFLKEQKRVGRFDSRLVGDARGDDPSYSAVHGPYTAALNQYIRSELKYENDLPYEILGGIASWDFGAAGTGYLNISTSLRTTMVENPALRVFVANGYYDLATPYFATDYTVNHLNLPPSLRDHVTMSYYHAGHMMYIHPPSLKKFKKDLAAFVETCVPAS